VEGYGFEITEEGKNQILTNYHILGLSEPHVIEQNAGIRPTTFDRRPFIGEHPQLKRNYILNGLGTKGYMLAPLLAKELVAHILHDEKLDPEVSLNRTD